MATANPLPDSQRGPGALVDSDGLRFITAPRYRPGSRRW